MREFNAFLASLCRQTFRAPKDAARQVIALNLPNAFWWQVMIASTFIATILMWMQTTHLAANDPAFFSVFDLMGGPIKVACIGVALTAFYIWAGSVAGRFFGGTGTFSDTLAVFSWFQAMSAGINVVLTILTFSIPFLGSIGGLAYMIASVWIFTNFIAAVHGFKNLVLVLMGSVFIGFVILLCAGIFLQMFGFVNIAEVPINVQS